MIAVSTAVDKIIAHFSTARNLVQKVRAWAEALMGLGWLEGRKGHTGFGRRGLGNSAMLPGACHILIAHLWRWHSQAEPAGSEESHHLPLQAQGEVLPFPSPLLVPKC